MNKLKEIVLSGKTNKGNKRQQTYINISVLLGFILLFFWTSLYEKTFLDVKIVLLVLFLPSLIAAFFLFKKYLAICGYSGAVERNAGYNVLIRLLVFLLIAMPVGNFTVFTFLFTNQQFAAAQTRTVKAAPENIYEGQRKGTKYTSYEISHDGITKRLRSYQLSAEEMQKQHISITMRKGCLGFDFYEKYTYEPNQNNWQADTAPNF
jgi:hypothetical protein